MNSIIPINIKFAPEYNHTNFSKCYSAIQCSQLLLITLTLTFTFTVVIELVWVRFLIWHQPLSAKCEQCYYVVNINYKTDDDCNDH